ncbi:hemerythrin domain-containing protein [Natranaerobius trueperi]|uniref:Hemerythrin-like domain-containing protein n=1 Tax=Natranaerobius trueperi TaxID=759412 RepID=A0A226C0I6_9FIRM|nr:hemerythrin domain-containing protein [Natranaerobius trueperi]OWZ84685.1 hypothetical protein CDO51_01270 [Natranaerobius trueperi]
MDALELMTEEHTHIKKMLDVLRKKCLNILNNPDEKVNTDFFTRALDFIRYFADKYHHGKEEDMLFGMLIENGGSLEKTLIDGMESEHNLGRLYISQLEEALNEYDNGSKEAKLDIMLTPWPMYIYSIDI